MAKLEFDPKKLKLVDIDKIFPNSWNPKEEDTKEFQKVKESIRLKGLRGAVVVRDFPNTPGSYEILDGQQRYTAAKQLDYKQIYVYDEGAVDDKEAREMTIWYQQQVPFNRITEAYLVTEMVDMFGLEELEVPYNDVEIKEFKDLAEFNFDMYDKDGDSGKENEDGTVNFTVKLSQYQFNIVDGGLKKYANDNGLDQASALTELLQSYVPNTGEKDV